MRNSTRCLVAVVATAALGLSVGGCNRGESGGTGETVTLAVSTLNNPFFLQLRNGAQQAADQAGVELEVVDAQDDSATQANQLANAATQDVDAVLVNPVDSAAAAPAVRPVLEEDIPVIAVDREVEVVQVASTVASDNVNGGMQAADALAEAIDQNGQVIHLQGVPGTSASRDRGKGFATGLEQYGDIDVVAKQPANFDRAEALDVTTNLVQADPDVDAIFAENDEMALGAIQALGDRAGSEVQVIGFDGTPEGLQAVRDGTMYGTVAQQPDLLGRVAFEQAVTAIDGGNPSPKVPVEVQLVTAENVDQFSQ